MRWGTEKEEGIRRKEGEWKGEERERGRGRGGEYEEDKKNRRYLKITSKGKYEA